MNIAILLLLSALMLEGWAVIRYFAVRVRLSPSCILNNGILFYVGIFFNLAFMCFVIMSTLVYIRNRERFRDAALSVSCSVMTERLGCAPSRLRWCWSGGGIRVVSYDEARAGESCSVQVVERPFHIYVR